MKVLVAYDGSIFSDAAMDDMRRAGLPDEGEALILCVSEATTSRRTWTSKLQTADSLAEIASNRLQSYFPKWDIKAEALWGSPVNTILETVSRWRPDLLVVGSHGRSRTAQFVMGSVSRSVLEQAPCSVRVARAGLSVPDAPIRVVIGTDGSIESDAVINAVAHRSWPQGTKCRIVSVVNVVVPSILEDQGVDAAEHAWLRGVVDDSIARLSRAGLAVTGVLVDGDPKEDLLREAEDWRADTIFIGARGLGRMERMLLGSVSSVVGTRARCSVEVVRR